VLEDVALVRVQRGVEDEDVAGGVRLLHELDSTSPFG
jgi:hypothetical protein